MVLLVRAIVSIILKTSSIDSLRPMMFENWWDKPSVRFSSTFSGAEMAILDLLADLHLEQVDVQAGLLR